MTKVFWLLDALRRPSGLTGFLIILLFLTMAVLAPFIAPYSFVQQDIANKLQGPSWDYLFGTDHLGRDILSRLIYGSRIAFGTAIPAVSVALTLGIMLGLAAGYVGGIVDNIIVVIINSLQSFPSVILALAILALLGPSLVNVVIVIGITWAPGYARVIRAQTLAAREKAYVQAERSLGAGDVRVLFSHILPNIIAPVLILVAMDLPWVITFEAGLSFLGLGVRPPTPSWGVILSDGFQVIWQSPWPILWSGLFLCLPALGFTLFGEALRDALDPKMSEKGAG
ncbi:MAG: ABC transporter permease [Desulfovibrionaceae bacterium]|nr:ABC transporter permease [Desulfovibrionaceae bacterium]